jgi:diphosphomevalonate decarboxylase
LDYSLPQTFQLIQQIKTLRKTGLPVYFTQDAGPNLKILFLEKDFEKIQSKFQEALGGDFSLRRL